MLCDLHFLQHLWQLVAGIFPALLITIARDLGKERRTKGGAAENRHLPTSSYCPHLHHAFVSHSDYGKTVSGVAISPEPALRALLLQPCRSSSSAHVLR